MEQIRSADHISVIRDEFAEPRSAKIDPASIQRIDRALAAAANNLDEARQALETLCVALPDSAGKVSARHLDGARDVQVVGLP